MMRAMFEGMPKMTRRPLIGLFAGLVFSIAACSTDDGGLTMAGNATPSQTPIVGDAIHGANVTQQTIAGFPSQVLDSVEATGGTTVTSGGFVEPRDTREKIEDRRVLRRNESGLPMSAEDRQRTRLEERRSAQTAGMNAQR